jgi:hypothetical protein
MYCQLKQFLLITRYKFINRNVTRILQKIHEKLELVLCWQFIVVNLFTTILCITRNNKFKVKKFINFFDRVKQALHSGFTPTSTTII